MNSDAVKSAIRREVRRVADVIIDEDTIEKILREEVVNRETLEGPEADSAAKRVARNWERSIVKEREVKDEPEETKTANTSVTVALPPKLRALLQKNRKSLVCAADAAGIKEGVSGRWQHSISAATTENKNGCARFTQEERHQNVPPLAV